MDDMSPSAAALAAERDAYLRQRDEALGERNELRRQLDIALGERNELRRQLDIAIGEANLSAEFCDHYAHRAEMTAPLGGRILLFLHLAKTGGMTLADILARNFRPDEFLQVSPDDTEPSALGTWSTGAAVHPIARMRRPEKLRAVWGHWGPGVRAFLPRPCAAVTLLRDPREVIVSAYHYTDAHVRLKRTFDEYMAEQSDYPIGFDNPLTRVLSARPELNPADPDATTATQPTVTEADLSAAIAVLDDCMLVGVTERFDETLLILAADLGWTLSDLVYTRLNVTGHRPALAELTPATRKKLSDLTAFDARLHARAREHLGRRIRSYRGARSSGPCCSSASSMRDFRRAALWTSCEPMSATVRSPRCASPRPRVERAAAFVHEVRIGRQARVALLLESTPGCRPSATPCDTS
jgi:Galactose-3-O-sulfotransferase